MIPGYDKWKLMPYAEEEKVAFDCDYCGNEVYVGEEYVETVEGYKIHNDCFYDFVHESYVAFCGVAEVSKNES